MLDCAGLTALGIASEQHAEVRHAHKRSRGDFEASSEVLLEAAEEDVEIGSVLSDMHFDEPRHKAAVEKWHNLREQLKSCAHDVDALKLGSETVPGLNKGRRRL